MGAGCARCWGHRGRLHDGVLLHTVVLRLGRGGIRGPGRVRVSRAFAKGSRDGTPRTRQGRNDPGTAALLSWLRRGGPDSVAVAQNTVFECRVRAVDLAQQRARTVKPPLDVLGRQLQRVVAQVEARQGFTLAFDVGQVLLRRGPLLLDGARCIAQTSQGPHRAVVALQRIEFGRNGRVLVCAALMEVGGMSLGRSLDHGRPLRDGGAHGRDGIADGSHALRLQAAVRCHDTTVLCEPHGAVSGGGKCGSEHRGVVDFAVDAR